MSENASSRSRPPEAGAGRDPGRLPDDPALPPSCEELIQELPDRFRGAGIRLARLLFGPGAPRLEPDADAARGDRPWYAGLELEEAWAVAQAFRRGLAGAGETSARRADDARPDVHAAIDRSLLAAARDALERSADAHRRIVQDVSHDLRSPLNSILFLADALRSQRSGTLTDVQSHQVSVLYTAAVTLVRMTNDLIDFSRIGVGRERIVVTESSFSLETVIQEVRSLVAPLASHRGVDVVTRLEAEGLRQGDQRLLARVLLNLASNAIEATDRGGAVTMEFGDTPDGGLRLEVSDDRPGTDVELLRSLLHGTEGEWPGETRGWTRGLGLAISARFVQAAGGRIDVFSRAGRATVFRVELPFRHL